MAEKEMFDSHRRRRAFKEAPRVPISVHPLPIPLLQMRDMKKAANFPSISLMFPFSLSKICFPAPAFPKKTSFGKTCER